MARKTNAQLEQEVNNLRRALGGAEKTIADLTEKLEKSDDNLNSFRNMAEENYQLLLREKTEIEKKSTELEADLLFQENELKNAVAANEGLANENDKLQRDLEAMTSLMEKWKNASNFNGIQLRVALASRSASIEAHEDALAELLGLEEGVTED